MRDLVVIVLTLDEADNLGKALASVGSRAPVLVVDSGSTDATLAIARSFGAEILEHPFADYASQRNYALEHVRDAYRWVFFLDADEEIPPELWDEIDDVVQRDEVDGAYVGLVVYLLGRELRHGSFSNTAILRLMRAEKARFTRATNERVDDSQMRVVRLQSKLVHADAKPLSQWFRKHVAYAEREARQYVEGDDVRRGLEGFSLRTKGGRTIGVRWAYNKMPLFVRPFVNFGRVVVAGSAWRDGIPGLLYAGMWGLWYPMLIDLFIYEARHRHRHRNHR